MLIGCGLRRAGIVGVKIGDARVREDQWVLADLVGKGGHMRTVPVPEWAKSAIDSWITAAHLQSGVLCRSVSKVGKVWGSRLRVGRSRSSRSTQDRTGLEPEPPDRTVSLLLGRHTGTEQQWSRAEQGLPSYSAVVPSSR
jgi:hypothetical protein